MKSKIIKLLGGVALATTVLSAPTAALAGVSRYENAGYSEDIAANALRVCDIKADGNGAYGKWWRTWNGSPSGEVRNSGGSGTCVVGAEGNRVEGHQVFMDLSGRPDPSGPKVRGN